MKRKIIINEKIAKWYSMEQLKLSGLIISNVDEVKTDKDTLVDFIIEQMKLNKVGFVNWACFLQELKNCIEIINLPETIEEIKDYYKNNNRIEIDDRSVKDRCYIWILNSLGELKLAFVIAENKIECISLDTKIESIADLCLIINKILGK